MKNTVLLTLSFIAALTTFASADTLDSGKIRITGTILQKSNSAAGTTVIPITLPKLLGLLGLSGTNPKLVRYYYDEDINGYVIAPAGITSGSSVAPLATVINFGNSHVSWNGATPINIVGGIAASGLNDSVTGAANYTQSLSKTHIETVRASAVLSGSLNATATTVNMSITDMFKTHDL